MKLIPLVDRNDFAASYFAKIFWDEVGAIDTKDRRTLLVDFFGIEKEKIRAIKNINNDTRKDLFVNYKTDIYTEDFNKIKNYFIEPNKNLIKEIIIQANEVLPKYLFFLNELFGNSFMEKEIKISFLDSYYIDFYHGFTFRFISDKIYIFLDKNKTDVNAYVKTILHELTHIFLTGNSNYQNILKQEWENRYKDIKGSFFRNFIEENIVSNIINGNIGFGFAYEYINLSEDKVKKEEYIRKNSYHNITLNFLNDLKNNNSNNKLEQELPKFLKNITEVRNSYKK